MLVLSRKASEAIRIGEDIRLVVVRIDGRNVRIGIEAPDGVTILREELVTGQSSLESDASRVRREPRIGVRELEATR